MLALVLVTALLGQVDNGSLSGPIFTARRGVTCLACTCTDSTNYALQSQRFDNAAWTKGQNLSAIPVVTVSNGTATYADPAGGFTAQRVQISDCSTGNAQSYVYQQTAAVAGNVVASVYIAAFDRVSTQSISVSIYDAAAGLIATPCTVVGGGWVKCTATVTAAVNSYILLGCNNGNPYPGHSNTGAADVLMWQGQLEPGTAPTCPLVTTTTSTARSGGIPCTAVCR